MALEFAGPVSVAWDPDDEGGAELQRIVLNSFQSSIAGGTDEIQRNIIGDRVLGLPREPAVDRGVPFRDLKVGTQTALRPARRYVWGLTPDVTPGRIRRWGPIID